MEASAVTAALGLLRKVVPDMQAVDLKAELANKRDIREYSDAELLAIVTESGGDFYRIIDDNSGAEVESGRRDA